VTDPAINPDDAELLFRKGVLHPLMNQPDTAGQSLRRILTLRRREPFASVDGGHLRPCDAAQPRKAGRGTGSPRRGGPAMDGDPCRASRRRRINRGVDAART
jgi:hypothetical protein